MGEDKSNDGACAVEKPEPKEGVQVFQQVAAGQADVDPVGRPVVHTSALKAATGEAQFVDDMPHYTGKIGAIIGNDVLKKPIRVMSIPCPTIQNSI